MAASLLLLHVGRGTTWFFDDWSWILTRRTGSLDDYLANHNGHLNLVPVLVYKAMWSVFGLTDYTAFRILAVVVHVGTCLLLFAYLRRRAQLWFAVSATIVVLFLGYAFQDLVWPFQIQFTGAMAGGLAALLLLDRDDRVGDVGASIALAISVACSGVGLPFVGAVTLELLLRRKTWRRLWVPLIPLALWGIWYLQYGQSQVKGSNVHLVPENAAQMGSAAVGALLGLSMDDGHVPLALLGIVVVVVLAVDRRISPRFAAVLALPLGYWILTSLSRARSSAIRPRAATSIPAPSSWSSRSPSSFRVCGSPALARCGRRRARARGAGRGLVARQRRPAPPGCGRAPRRLDPREGGAPIGGARTRPGGPGVPSRPDPRAADRRRRLPRRGRRSRVAGRFARARCARNRPRSRAVADAVLVRAAAGTTPCRARRADRRRRAGSGEQQWRPRDPRRVLRAVHTGRRGPRPTRGWSS